MVIRHWTDTDTDTLGDLLAHYYPVPASAFLMAIAQKRAICSDCLSAFVIDSDWITILIADVCPTHLMTFVLQLLCHHPNMFAIASSIQTLACMFGAALQRRDGGLEQCGTSGCSGDARECVNRH